MKALAATLLAAVGLLVAELAAGGLDHGGQHVPGPCRPRPALAGSGVDTAAQQLALRSLDVLACRLGKNREQLVLDLGRAGVDALKTAKKLQGRIDRLQEKVDQTLRRLGLG